MDFNSSQQKIIQLIARISSGLGLFGGLAIIWILLWKRLIFASPLGLLIFVLSFLDIINSFAKGLGEIPASHGSFSIPCQLQAAFAFFSDLGCVFLYLLLSSYFVYLLAFNGSIAAIRKNQIRLIFFVLGVSAACSLALYFIKLNDGSKFYGYTGLWCRLPQTDHNEVNLVWCILLWIAMVLNVTAYLVTLRAAYHSESFLSYFDITHLAPYKGSKSQPVSSTSRYTHSHESVLLKRMLLYVITFFVVWLPGNVNKVYLMLSNGHYSFILFLGYATVSPLRGFIHFLAFLISRTYFLYPTHVQRHRDDDSFDDLDLELQYAIENMLSESDEGTSTERWDSSRSDHAASETNTVMIIDPESPVTHYFKNANYVGSLEDKEHQFLVEEVDDHVFLSCLNPRVRPASDDRNVPERHRSRKETPSPSSVATTDINLRASSSLPPLAYGSARRPSMSIASTTPVMSMGSLKIYSNRLSSMQYGSATYNTCNMSSSSTASPQSRYDTISEENETSAVQIPSSHVMPHSCQEDTQRYILDAAIAAACGYVSDEMMAHISSRSSSNSNLHDNCNDES